MLEKTVRKRLRRATFFVLLTAVVLLAGGFSFYLYLQNSRSELVKNQTITEAEEYKSRLLKQLRGDFQILSSIGELLDLSSQESIASSLNTVHGKTDFLNIAYFDNNLSGVISARENYPVTDAALTDLSPQGADAVLCALEGEESISSIFESSVSQSRVFVYSIPIKRNGEIVGAISASDHVDVFSDIISGNAVLGGGGYLHMIDSEGNFLIKSEKMIVKEDIPSVFDGPYLSDEEKTAVKGALSKGERVFSSFDYKGESYSFLLEPVGVNGWYLFTVNAGEGLSRDMTSTLLTAQIIFAAVLVVIFALMIYGYRTLRSYNKELTSFAYHDRLTEAENLTRFKQRLGENLNGGYLAVIEIRQFPFLVEIFGRQTADELLCYIAKEFAKNLDGKDFFCRDSEDRFYLFFPAIDERQTAAKLEKLTSLIENNGLERLSGYRLAVYGGVISAAEIAKGDKTGETLLSKVHFALESARGSHQSKLWFFDSELHKKEELENYIESHMYDALKSGEFSLYLQPKYDLKGGEICGAEALVRWKTSEGKMIFPDRFIPLFEKNGFCSELDLYMTQKVCELIAEWKAAGKKPLPISVNQTKLLFFDNDYVDKLCTISDEYGVCPSFVTLEILEGLALEGVERLNGVIDKLHEKGFSISLDDFGSGYSSLNTLGKLNIDELKLDRGFLLSASETDGERVRLIMEQTVRMASRLGVKTVAEGVETAKDEAFIAAIGCNTAQGYYYSRPIPAAEFTEKYIR